MVSDKLNELRGQSVIRHTHQLSLSLFFLSDSRILIVVLNGIPAAATATVEVKVHSKQLSRWMFLLLYSLFFIAAPSSAYIIALMCRRSHRLRLHSAAAECSCVLGGGGRVPFRSV
jgi:hypothetical protein